MILNGLIWVRKQSKSITINTLNYRVIYWFWERSRFKNARICTIDRNDIYMAHFISGGKIEKDMDDFSTIRFKLKLIDEHITALVLCMDHMDVMDMLESLNSHVHIVSLGDVLVLNAKLSIVIGWRKQ